MKLDYKQIRDIFDLAHPRATQKVLTDDNIKDIIMALKNPGSPGHYGFIDALKAVKENIVEKDYVEITNNFLNNSKDYITKDVLFYLYEALGHDNFLNLFEASKVSYKKNIYIALDKYTPEQEIKALRAITGKSKIWDRVYQKQYRMSKEAIETLPPVMRVKVLEYFLDVDFLPYNIFSKIEEDDFKALLFGASLRHNDKANFVWQRYQELTKVNKPVKVRWKFNCDTCGEFSVQLENKMIVSERILKETRIYSNLEYHSCPVCSKYMNNKTQIFMDNID